MKVHELKAFERVSIYRGRTLAGHLRRTDAGAIFQYEPSFRAEELKRGGIGIATTLRPAREEHECRGSNLHPFFAGLLPEGLRLKALWQTLKTSEDDLFTMLPALGTDCIGDVYATPGDEKAGVEPDEFKSPPLETVSFNKLFEQSIYSDELSVREADPGVPGGIPKISGSMISFSFTRRRPRTHYILKFQPADRPNLVNNEHFFMTLARRCGFEVPLTKIVYDRDHQAGLLVARFDRALTAKGGGFAKVHQEDACQLLNRYPQDKYRLSMHEIATALQIWCGAPLVEIQRLIELYLFCYLIGNGDLHGKNISVTRGGRTGQLRLSPWYDLVSTLPYGDRHMALMLEGRNDNFQARDFINFGSHFSIPERAVRASIAKVINKCRPLIPEVESAGFDPRESADIIKLFEARARALEGN